MRRGQSDQSIGRQERARGRLAASSSPMADAPAGWPLQAIGQLGEVFVQAHLVAPGHELTLVSTNTRIGVLPPFATKSSGTND
jgi:hypothetical protein